MNASILTPAGYDLGHWVAVVAFTFVIWQVCSWLRSKVKV